MHAPPGGRDVMTLHAGEAGAGGSRQFLPLLTLLEATFPTLLG